MNRPRKGIISTILAPACTIWLKSQVSGVEELSVEIDTSDRRILKGSIDRLSILADEVIYKGLFLGKINLVARDININIGQVLKGQPLSILEPIPIDILLRLKGHDIQKSLSAPLLAGGLTDLFNQIINTIENPINYQINWQGIVLDQDKLTLKGEMISEFGDREFLTLMTGLEVVDGHILLLKSLTIDSSIPSIANTIEEYTIDLGPEVNLSNLEIQSEEIICEGIMLVKP